MFRKIGIFFSGTLFLLGVIWLLMIFWPETALSKTVDANYQQLATNVTETVLAEPIVENTKTPEATPTPMVANYLLGSTVDLSSGGPISLTVELPDGNTIHTNWAGTLAYKYTDDIESVFAPDKGVVYSYLGDVTTTWAHSGITSYGQKYFATDLDVYLRKKPGNIIMTTAEAKVMADGLVGAEAHLCQVDSGTVKLLSDYTQSACPGKLVDLEVVAVAIIPREKVEEYKADPLNVNQWLVSNYPDAGFDQLNSTNGWLVSFCVGKFADQTSDGTPSYLYNRGVIGFRIKDGSS